MMKYIHSLSFYCHYFKKNEKEFMKEKLKDYEAELPKDEP